MNTSASMPDITQDGLRDEYDEPTLREMLAKGVRGKYVASVPQAVNVITLEPDVAAHFTDAAIVNVSLCFLIMVI